MNNLFKKTGRQMALKMNITPRKYLREITFDSSWSPAISSTQWSQPHWPYNDKGGLVTRQTVASICVTFSDENFVVNRAKFVYVWLRWNDKNTADGNRLITLDVSSADDTSYSLVKTRTEVRECRRVFRVALINDGTSGSLPPGHVAVALSWYVSRRPADA